MRATAISEDIGVSLEVNVGAATVEGNISRVNVKPTEAQFIYLLVSEAPEILLHARVESEILGPSKLGEFDPLTYIRKLKLHCNRALLEATGARELIISVRGQGYKLNGRWRIEAASSTSPKILSTATNALHRLASDCLDLMATLTLASDADGVHRLDASGARTMEGDFYQILALVPEAKNIDERVIQDLASYFAFQRQGAVADPLWRELFRRELTQRLDYLIMALAREIARI